MTPTTTITSLPNELLGKILEEYDISLAELFGLAFLCHRLRQISLSVYIKKSGLPKVTKRCVITIPYRPESHDLVTALSFSSDVTKTRYFHCNFPKFATERGMLHQFLRVARLVTKLTEVKKVVLNFNSFERNTYVFPVDEAMAWSYGLGSLLNAIAERGCSSLEVRGLLKTMNMNPQVVQVIMPPPEPRQKPPTVFSRLRKAFKSAKSSPTQELESNALANSRSWQVDRQQVYIPVNISPLAARRSALTHLTIASKFFLCPPILRWTYSVLAVSPLHSLTIEDVDFYSHCATWDTLTELFQDAAPALKVLKLQKCRRLSKHQVTRFVSGFIQLECLTLETVHSFGEFWDSDPWVFADGGFPSFFAEFYFLARLTTFRAELMWIPLALRSYARGYFPALQTLTVISRSYVDWTDWAMDWQFQGELANLGHNPTLSVEVELLVPEVVVEWMQELAAHNTSLGGAWWTKSISGIILLVDKRLVWGHQRDVTDIVRWWYHQFPRLKKLAMNARINDAFVVGSVEEFCRSELYKVAKGLEHFEVNRRLLQPSTRTL